MNLNELNELEESWDDVFDDNVKTHRWARKHVDGLFVALRTLIEEKGDR